MVPKYNLHDNVTFKIEEGSFSGTIVVVDPHGTWENPNEVSYDVIGDFNGKETLFKHISEHLILHKN